MTSTFGPPCCLIFIYGILLITAVQGDEGVSFFDKHQNVTVEVEKGGAIGICTTGDYSGDDCVAYSYEASEGILAVVLPQHKYDEAFQDGRIDFRGLPLDDKYKDSACVGDKCNKKVHIKDDEDWCLIFANHKIPMLGFRNASSAMVDVTYSLDECSADEGDPILHLIAGIVILVALSVVLILSCLCCWWRCKPWTESINKQTDKQTGKDYEEHSRRLQLQLSAEWAKRLEQSRKENRGIKIGTEA